MNKLLKVVKFLERLFVWCTCASVALFIYGIVFFIFHDDKFILYDSIKLIITYIILFILCVIMEYVIKKKVK